MMRDNGAIGFSLGDEAAGRMTEALKRMARRVPRPRIAVTDWPLWSLPRWLTVFVLTVIAVDLAAIGVAACVTTITRHDVLLFGLLLSCTALAVEMSRKAGEQGGMIKDVQGVWELPVAILLPPLYALIAPIPRFALMQWRVRRAPLYRRVFSAASVGLSYGAASVTFHGLARLFPDDGIQPARQVLNLFPKDGTQGNLR